MFELLFLIWFIALPLLGLLGVVLFLFGFRMVRNPKRAMPPPQPVIPPAPQPAQPVPVHDRTAILLEALDSPVFYDNLLPHQRRAIRHALLHPEVSLVAEPASPARPPAMAVPPRIDIEALDDQASASESFAAKMRDEADDHPAPQSVDEQPREHRQPVSVPRLPAFRKPAIPSLSVDSIRASWDPAVVMLYLGALLVVIAGLIFASYGWGTWGGWQKLGMLMAATAGFLLAGLALRGHERIRPAAETFLTIGGLLVPVNALAAYTIFHDADPLLVLFTGAVATAIVHGLLALQPDSRLFCYTSVVAAVLALASLPGAVGLPTAWGCVLALSVFAIAPDPWGRLEHFSRAWMWIGTAAIVPLVGIGFVLNQGEQDWVLPALLVGTSMNANRAGQRMPQERGAFNIGADLLLVIANVTAAWVLTDERWLMATAMLSMALMLVRMSRNDPFFANQLEMAAAFPAAAFLGNVSADLFSYDTGFAVFFGFITIAMMFLARRWPEYAELAHGIAAFGLPATFFMPLDPIWDLAVLAAVLTLTLIAWRTQHALFGDAPFAAASCTAIAAVFLFGNAFQLDSIVAWVWLLVAIALILTTTVNLLTPMLLQEWVRNVLRVEAIGLFLLAFLIHETQPWVLVLALVVMGWNMAVTQHAAWSLPMAGFIALVYDRFVQQPDTSSLRTWWLFVFEMILLAALAWQLDRRSILNAANQLTAGIYVWCVGGLLTFTPLTWDGVHFAESPVGITFAMLVIALIFGFAWYSTGINVLGLPAAAYVMLANMQLLATAEVESTTALFVAAAIATAITAIANLVPQVMMPPWLRNLVRIQALILFALAWQVEAPYPVIWVVAMVAMGWNMMASRHAIWSLPAALILTDLFTRFVVVEDPADYWAYLWDAAPVLILAALAWRLDRSTIQSRVAEFTAGIYVWAVVVVMSIALSAPWRANSVETLVGIPLGLLAIAGVHWIAWRSTSIPLFLLPPLVYIGQSFEMLLRPAVPDRDHAIVAGIALVGAVWLYWREGLVRMWVGFALLTYAVLHLNASLDRPAVQGLLIGLVTVWVLMSIGVVRWGSAPDGWQVQSVFLQAILLHGIALWAPSLGDAIAIVTQSAIVIALLSLAGTIAVYGSLVRNRMYVLAASAIAMTALLVQINSSEPTNIHAYTVPLAFYLFVVGLLFRKHSLEANVLLAAGSGVLVLPAMMEALSTGSITWLWISLAESLVLFLLGTTIRLQIPAAAGVISVTVIVLRMLVMAINVFESWVGILAIGVALLILGTIWLIYRDQIQERVQHAYMSWLAFD